MYDKLFITSPLIFSPKKLRKKTRRKEQQNWFLTSFFSAFIIHRLESLSQF